MKLPRHKVSRSSGGFSLVEVMVVLGIILIILGFAIPQIRTSMREAKTREGYEDVLTQIRQAREIAVDRRRVCVLTFNAVAGGNPANIVLLQEDVTINPLTGVHTYQPIPRSQMTLPNPLTINLPNGMDFLLPTTQPTATPDSIGTQPIGNPIDFGYTAAGGGGAQNTMYFQANGQVLTGSENGPVANGVIYVGKTGGDPATNRAVSILGSTGRAKGWRLGKDSSGNPIWVEQ